MSLTIHDFSPSDRNMYFSGSYIHYRTKKGKLRAGVVDRFLANNKVYIIGNQQHTIVSLNAIEWNGLSSTRCVKCDGGLAVVSPAGDRGYKKSVTTDNLMYMLFNHDGTIAMHSSRRSLFPSTLLNDYLDMDYDYPDPEIWEELLHGQPMSAALTPRVGIVYQENTDRIRCIKDSVIGLEAESYRQAYRWAREVTNDDH